MGTDDFSERRRINALKREINQEARRQAAANATAAAAPALPPPLPTWFILLTAWFAGVGVKLCTALLILYVTNVLTGKSFTLFFRNLFRGETTPFFWLSALSVLVCGGVAAGYVVGRLRRSRRWLNALLVGGAYSLLMLAIHPDFWAAVPVVAAVSGAALTTDA